MRSLTGGTTRIRHRIRGISTVILKSNPVITPIKVKGVPDLVIEILSPSNRKYDRELKRQRYEQAGVAAYWIVDPRRTSYSPSATHHGWPVQ